MGVSCGSGAPAPCARRRHRGRSLAAVRVCDGRQQSGQRHARERTQRLALRLLTEGPQDLAAAPALAHQLGHILRERAVLRYAVGELARGHRDGGERTAEVMRRRGRKAAQRGQLLLAGERHLRGRQRIRQPARLVGDAPGIAGDQRRAEHQREPQAADVERRQAERALRHGRSVGNRASRWRPRSPEAEHHRRPQRQRGRRKRHRHDQQDRERVLQPAGQRQQKRQLQDVVAQQQGGAALGQPRGRGEAERQPEIDQRRQRDGAEQRTSGSRNSSEKWTSAIVNAWPTIAIQRIRMSVRSRSRRSPSPCGWRGRRPPCAVRAVPGEDASASRRSRKVGTGSRSGCATTTSLSLRQEFEEILVTSCPRRMRPNSTHAELGRL